MLPVNLVFCSFVAERGVDVVVVDTGILVVTRGEDIEATGDWCAREGNDDTPFDK